MKIRIARLEDVPAIAAIYRPYVEQSAVTFETAAPDVQTFQERFLGISSFERKRQKAFIYRLSGVFSV